MKKFTFIFAILLCFFNCKEDNLCYGDPFEISLFIEIIDSNGNNLITNNTFSSENIITRFNGYENKSPVVESLLDKENLIQVDVIGIEGDNTFEIQLSNSITDILIMNISNEITDPPCSTTIPTLNSVSYNGIDQTLKNFEGYLITVVK